MKKEYLTPDVWVLDLVAVCMQNTPEMLPQSGTDNDKPEFGAPGRRGIAGPASL